MIDFFLLDLNRLTDSLSNCYQLEINETNTNVYILKDNHPIWCNNISLEIIGSIEAWHNYLNSLFPKIRLCQKLIYLTSHKDLSYLKLLPYYLDYLEVNDFTTLTCKLPYTLTHIKSYINSKNIVLPKNINILDIGNSLLNREQWDSINKSSLCNIYTYTKYDNSYWQKKEENLLIRV